MINITPTNQQDIAHFLEEQWTIEDKEHYGEVGWQDASFLFKAEENGLIIGVAMGRIQSGVVLIEDIIVHREQRGKGVGKLLVAKIESFAKENQAHKVWGYTGKGWPAVDFYKSLGYQVIGELPKHFHQKDFVIISKNI